MRIPGRLKWTGLRQRRLTHQEAVAFAGGTAAFVEGPDDEGLTTAAVTGGKDAGDAGGVFLVLGFHVAALVTFDVEGFEQGLFRPSKWVAVVR